MKKERVNFFWSVALLVLDTASIPWLMAHGDMSWSFWLLAVCFVLWPLWATLSVYTFSKLFSKNTSAGNILSPETAINATGTIDNSGITSIAANKKTSWLPTVEWKKFGIGLPIVATLALFFRFFMGLTWQGAFRITIAALAGYWILYRGYLLVKKLRQGPPVGRFKRCIRMFASFCILFTAILIPIIIDKTGHGQLLEESTSSAIFMFGIFVLGLAGLVAFVANLIRLVIGR